MLPRTGFVIVTAVAMRKLLTNSTVIAGVSSVAANCQPAVVNGSGMSVSRTESGSVLNDVTTDHVNGTNIRIAKPIRNTYTTRRRHFAPVSPACAAAVVSGTRAEAVSVVTASEPR